MWVLAINVLHINSLKCGLYVGVVWNLCEIKKVLYVESYFWRHHLCECDFFRSLKTTHGGALTWLRTRIFLVRFFINRSL